jgi:hypothetical protein
MQFAPSTHRPQEIAMNDASHASEPTGDAATGPDTEPRAGGDAPRHDDASTGATWQAPWVASPEHPHGAADLQPPPQTSTGHYGPGYDDPTRHFGGTLPGQPEANEAPAGSTATEAEAPALRSDEVGFRPPDHLPDAKAPESENAALIFERS